MISSRRLDEQSKQLTFDELDEVRDCWRMGVPLRILASQHGIIEPELKFQLERHRQLAALRQRFGSRLDG